MKDAAGEGSVTVMVKVGNGKWDSGKWVSYSVDRRGVSCNNDKVRSQLTIMVKGP